MARGERALIEAIAAALEKPPGSRVLRWVGDDCAVVRADGEVGYRVSPEWEVTLAPRAQYAFSRGRNSRPRLPAAPVSRTRTASG